MSNEGTGPLLWASIQREVAWGRTVGEEEEVEEYDDRWTWKRNSATLFH